MSKAALRDRALAARAVAHEQGFDAAAQAHLAGFLAQWRGRALSGYLPMRTEIDPRPVMQAWDGPVGVPVIEGRDRPLAFSLWRPGDELVAGSLGAPMPVQVAPMTPAVLIVPLVGFDRHGARLGYGGGYYDRTLAKLSGAGPVHAVGFAYSAQEVPPIPAESTDVPLHAVVTEAGVQVFDAR